MNQNYIHTITLYNRIQASDREDRKEHWKRIVLHNCFWKAQVNTGFNDTQASVQNTYAVRIPKDDRYLPYAEYKNSPEEHFTVSQGDIVICGECTEEITGESGKTAAQVLNRYKPSAFKVTAFSDNTSFLLAKHYRFILPIIAEPCAKALFVCFFVHYTCPPVARRMMACSIISSPTSSPCTLP